MYDSADKTPLSLPEAARTLSGRRIQTQYLTVGESIDIGMSIHTFDQFGRKGNEVVINARSDRSNVPNNIGSEDPE